MLKSVVLFVDDQEEIRFLIQRMLKEEPYTVIFAASGEEALNIISSRDVDVVVTDVLMPNMSGLELIEIIKESHPNIVRVILSGFSQIPTLLSAINKGEIFRYITKPWHVDNEAKEVIRDAIEYGNLLKLSKSSGRDSIELDKVNKLLISRNEDFVIIKDNKVVCCHSMVQPMIDLGQSLTKSEIEGMAIVSEFKILNHMMVYFFK